MYYVYEHLHNYLFSGSLTSCNRGNTYVLITQTNLIKLQIFCLLISYAFHLWFTNIHNITIFNCYLSMLPCVSFPLCSCFYSLLCPLSPLSLMFALFLTCIWSMNADVIHQVILSYQVRVTLGKDHIRWFDTCSWPLCCLDITRIWGSNENIKAYFTPFRVCILSNIIPNYPK